MAFSVFDFEKKEVLFLSIVMLIIFVVSFTQMRIGQAKTRDAQRRGDLELVSRALNAYLKDTNTLPKASPDGKIISCGRKALEECAWGESDLIDAYNVAYLKKIPTDPQTYKGLKYVYVPDLVNNKYKIYTALERNHGPNLTIACGTNVQCNYYVQN
jgi:hypothetical protein